MPVFVRQAEFPPVFAVNPPEDPGTVQPAPDAVETVIVHPEAAGDQRLAQKIKDKAGRHPRGRQIKQSHKHVQVGIGSGHCPAGYDVGNETILGHCPENRIDGRAQFIDVRREHDDIIHAQCLVCTKQ